jgi:diguanylate cyclase (GGDEF)-like protein/PAS domain S-box-containing protein
LRSVVPLIVVILFQAFLAGISLEVLSSVRAYVGGEGLWSKGQKDAIHFLTLYATTGNEQQFRQFERAIAIPLSDLAARRALERSPVDLDAAFRGFQGGGNHPNDIPGMIRLFRYLRDVPYLARAVVNWRATDIRLDQLAQLGEAIHNQRRDRPGDAAMIKSLTDKIGEVDRQLAPEALAFSRSLGEGSRAIKVLLTIANLYTAASLIALCVWHTRKMIGQRLRFEDALRAEKERAQITLASLGEAVITTDIEGQLTFMNRATEDLTRCAASDAIGRPLSSLFGIVDEMNEVSHLHQDHIGTNFSLDRVTLIRRDSSTVAVSVIGAPLQSDGQVSGAVLVFHDLTREQEFVAQLSWQASHDSLTGLSNRREFEARLEDALSRPPEQRSRCTVMFIDLDQFKVVNDTCGHAAGDLLLKRAADVLLGALKPTDLLARLGGDEFGVLLRDSDEREALQFAERLRQAVDELRFVWSEKNFSISASIGLVHNTEDSSVEETMRAADVACYISKERGRNRVQVFRPTDAQLAERLGEMGWIQRIRNGLDERRFCLFSQEIRAIASDEPNGSHIEMLLRLRDETGRLVSPAGFMPAAERYGLMPLIDRWVVKEAFELLAHRQSSRIVTCAINISGATLGDDGFVDFVRQQFQTHQIPPEMICFEITESSAIANVPIAMRLIESLRELGCRFSLDDFGTGMASFAYLKQLSVDYIKIDGSFVKEICSSPVDRAMVEMIVQVSRVAGKKCVAEFAENEEILHLLREIGVDYAQGYAIGRPQPFDLAYPLLGEVTREVA